MTGIGRIGALEFEIPNNGHQIKADKRFMFQLVTEAEEEVIVVPTLSVIREESDR